MMPFEDLWVEPPKVPLQDRTHFLLTPEGLLNLSNFHHLRDIEPCSSGTFSTYRGEEAQLDKVEDSPPRFFEHSLDSFDIDQAANVSISSHDPDLVLGLKLR